MARPIRVVLFGGVYLEPCALRFAVLLEEHPEIELAGILCQSSGTGWWFRQRELWQRRGVLAFALTLRDVLGTLARYLRAPVECRALHSRSRQLEKKIITVPDVHAPQVLERIRALAPDLGVIYGSPILRPELFGIPRFGTLGIHHGRVPHYRGKKTTFWEIYNGEPVAGVTIQRINSGIDTGEVVKLGEVPTDSRSYARVERDIQELGLRLYMQAILEVRQGCASFVPQPARTVATRLYRQPSTTDYLRLWLRIAARRLRFKRA